MAPDLQFEFIAVQSFSSMKSDPIYHSTLLPLENKIFAKKKNTVLDTLCNFGIILIPDFNPLSIRLLFLEHYVN